MEKAESFWVRLPVYSSGIYEGVQLIGSVILEKRLELAGAIGR